jgi:gamma-tubulin complex component 4
VRASAMIPDLLLALMGVPGDVFELERASDAVVDRLHVADGLSFMKRHEVERLNALVRVGGAYRTLERVTTNESTKASFATTPQSLYRRALAIGIQERLREYEEEILKLEQETLRRGTTSGAVNVIESALSDDGAVMMMMCEHLVGVFEGENALCGRDVIQRTRDAWLRAGHPAAREACGRLYWKVMQVMMQQLLGWCAHGTIVDPCDEFFVRTIAQKEGYDMKDEARDDGSGIWHESHRVALERLPPGVELSTAESVSFIGRGVRILTHPEKGGNMRGHFDPDGYAMRATSRIRRLAAAESFDPRDFEAEVEAMRSEIAASLGEVLLNESGLISHLNAMCGFYFLGRGDFYTTFLDEARELFSLPPKPGSASRELSTPFAQAVASTSTNDEVASRFRLVYTSALTQQSQNDESLADATPSTSFVPRVRIPEYDAWDGVSLECDVYWPMGIFLTVDTLDRYKMIFKYLFRLRRAHFDLQDAWIHLRRSGLTQTLRLRHVMDQLIENWRMYIQVDVIETELKKMLDKIAATTDFNKCALAHRQYLAAIMAHSFLDVGSIMTIFEDIFGLTRELYETSARYANGQPLPADWDDRIAYLTRQFEKNSIELFDNLRGGYVVELPELRALLMRFNFNEFFENTSSTGVNLTATKFANLDM